MSSKNLNPEGQRRKLLNQRLPTLEKKVNELVELCKAEVVIFILLYDDKEMWIYKSRINFPSESRASTVQIRTPNNWVRSHQRQPAQAIDANDQRAVADILPLPMFLNDSSDLEDPIDIEHLDRPLTPMAGGDIEQLALGQSIDEEETITSSDELGQLQSMTEGHKTDEKISEIAGVTQELLHYKTRVTKRL